MDELVPCPFCGEGHVLGDGEGDDNWFECMGCHARGPRTTFIDATDTDADRDAWNRRAPADPALLALAKLGAKLFDRVWIKSFGFVDESGLQDDLDRDAVAFGLVRYEAPGDFQMAPGIADAIAALLAPDGAGEAAP